MPCATKRSVAPIDRARGSLAAVNSFAGWKGVQKSASPIDLDKCDALKIS